MQLATLMFVPLPGATPQFTTEDKSALTIHADAVAGAKEGRIGDEIGQAAPDPYRGAFPYAVPLPAHLETQPSVAPSEEVGVMLDTKFSISPAAIPVAANLLAQPSVVPGEEVVFTADTPR